MNSYTRYCRISTTTNKLQIRMVDSIQCCPASLKTQPSCHQIHKPIVFYFESMSQIDIHFLFICTFCRCFCSVEIVFRSSLRLLSTLSTPTLHNIYRKIPMFFFVFIVKHYDTSFLLGLILQNKYVSCLTMMHHIPCLYSQLANVIHVTLKK